MDRETLRLLAIRGAEDCLLELRRVEPPLVTATTTTSPIGTGQVGSASAVAARVAKRRVRPARKVAAPKKKHPGPSPEARKKLSRLMKAKWKKRRADEAAAAVGA